MVQPSEVMAIEWLMLTLAWILVGLRVAVRLQASHVNLAVAVVVSDLFLVLGAFSILGLVVCDTLTYRMGAMSDFSMFSTELGKIRFATNYFFDVGLYLPKLSILAIYYQLVPPSQKTLRAGLHLLTAVTVAAVLVTVFTDTFWCGPDPSINWAIGEGLCSTFTSTTLMVSNWSMCITIEALLFLLPIPLLRQVKSLAGGQKIGLVVVFSLGIITMTVSAGRFISMMYTGNYISVYVWATTEFAVSIMVVSCMALRPLAAKTWRSTTNKITHHFSGNNSKKASGGSNGGTRTNRSSRLRSLHRSAPNTWDSPGAAGDSDVQLTAFPADGIAMGNSVSVSSDGRHKNGEEPVLSHGVFRECDDRRPRCASAADAV